MEYRIAINCPTCDRTIIKEIEPYTDEVEFLEINLADFATQEWQCEKCGCFILTPDEYSMYQIIEDGENPDEDDKDI